MPNSKYDIKNMWERYKHSTSQQLVQILHVEIGKVITLNDLLSSISIHERVHPGWVGLTRVFQGSLKGKQGTCHQYLIGDHQLM